MNNKTFLLLLAAALFAIGSPAAVFGQKPLLKRVDFKSDKIEFNPGSTLTIVGAPVGSVTIEGWAKNEIEVSAEVEIQAETEADLAELSKVNGFVFDEDANHIRLLSVGTHDKAYMKRVAKKFPKRLLGLPWKIDYRVKLPNICDVEVNSGKGSLSISGVEGSMILKAVETDAELTLTGGAITATFGSGSVNVNIAARSWRGRHADIQLANGSMNVKLIENINANISASILRTGKIENLYSALKPIGRAKFTDTSLTGKAGNGGAYLSFTVGDGSIRIAP